MAGGRIRAIQAIAATCALAGCASALEGQAPGDETMFGFTHIRRASSAGVVAYQVKTLGVGGGTSGGFLGWRATEAVMSDPRQCQVMVIVRDSVEAAHAASVLHALQGEQVCTADFSH